MLFNKKIDDDWFYSDTNIFLKILTIFIKGDAILIAPFILVLTIVLILNIDLGIILGLIFIFLRFLGEMVYWLLQQFSDKSYRPFDYGLTKLKNNSIYILYQLFSLIIASLALSMILYYLKFGI